MPDGSRPSSDRSRSTPWPRIRWNPPRSLPADHRVDGQPRPAVLVRLDEPRFGRVHRTSGRGDGPQGRIVLVFRGVILAGVRLEVDARPSPSLDGRINRPGGEVSVRFTAKGTDVDPPVGRHTARRADGGRSGSGDDDLSLRRDQRAGSGSGVDRFYACSSPFKLSCRVVSSLGRGPPRNAGGPRPRLEPPYSIALKRRRERETGT